MRWRKVAHIFDPRAHDWAGTHAQVPTVLVKDEVVRIFYSDRDNSGRSFPTYLDVERRNLSRVVNYRKGPVLDWGKPGTFDDEGVMPAFVFEERQRVYLYYSGWNRRCTVPYHNATGIAVSTDGGESFSRMFEGPILDRVPLEPYLAVTPWLLREGDLWRMWYISGVEWREIDGKYEPIYLIKYAESSDGIWWRRPNLTAVQPKHALEAFSHPTVIKLNGAYHMWYCYRHSRDFRDGEGSYRIGYACSVDGLSWDRRDGEAGIDVSTSGWDSLAISYPYALDIDGSIYMFYNGNGFGQTGIGYAVLEA